MAKIVRYEFLGNWGLFTLLFISGIGIPVAILILINGTVRIEEEMDSAEEFVAAYRAGKLRGMRKSGNG
jgi:hypothetical protein